MNQSRRIMAAESFGCRPEQLEQLPENVINTRIMLCMLFRKTEKTEQLACLLNSLVLVREPAGFLIHPDRSVFSFESMTVNIMKGFDFALRAKNGDALLIRADELLKVEPVSFKNSWMVFRLEGNGGTSWLHLNIDDQEYTEDLTLHDGLNREFYEISGYASLRKFAQNLDVLQRITVRDAAGMIIFDDQDQPEMSDGLISGFRFDEDSFCFEMDENEFRIHQDDTLEFGERRILGHSVYILSLSVNDTLADFLFDGDSSMTEEDPDDEDDWNLDDWKVAIAMEQEGGDVEIIRGILHVTGSDGSRKFERLYTGFDTKEAIEQLLEEGSVKDLLGMDPSDALSSFEDRLMIRSGERWAAVEKVKMASDFYRIILPFEDDMPPVSELDGLDDVIDAFNQCTLYQPDFPPEEIEKFIRDHDDGIHTVTIEEQDSLKSVIKEAVEQLESDEVPDLILQAFRNDCSLYSLGEDTMAFEADLPAYLIAALIRFSSEIEKELNAAVQEMCEDEKPAYQRLAFCFSTEADA